MLGRILGLATAATMVMAGSAWAENTSPQSGKTKDPNEIVCEKQEVIGSRLATKKVCMTRAQWADAKAQDRQAIEQAQTQRGAKGE